MLSKLKKDLNDIRIANLCKDIHLLNASTLSEDYVNYIIYSIYDTRDKNFGSNKAINRKFSIQVDVFSKEDFIALSNIIEEVLTEKGYTFKNCFDMFEKDTKLFHRAMRFTYLEYKK